jgi:hypothetical protein
MDAALARIADPPRALFADFNVVILTLALALRSGRI